MTESTTAPAKKILIVEDDKFLRDIVVSHLKKAQFEVVYATTGEEALQKAHDVRPDLIVLDIVLSGINGLDVMTRLQQDVATQGIPFLVFSNSDEPANLHRGKELGAVKYMVKALSTPEQIVREIKGFFVTKV